MIIKKKILEQTFKKIDACFHNGGKPKQLFVVASERNGCSIYGVNFDTWVAIEVDVQCRVFVDAVYHLSTFQIKEILKKGSEEDIFFSSVDEDSQFIVACGSFVDAYVCHSPCHTDYDRQYDIFISKFKIKNGLCRDLIGTDQNHLEISNKQFCDVYNKCKVNLQLRKLECRRSDGIGIQAKDGELRFMSINKSNSVYIHLVEDIDIENDFVAAIPSKIAQTIYKIASKKKNKSSIKIYKTDIAAVLKFEDITVEMIDGTYYTHQYPDVRQAVKQTPTHCYLVDEFQLDQLKRISKEICDLYKKWSMKTTHSAPNTAKIKATQDGINISIMFESGIGDDAVGYYAFHEHVGLECLMAPRSGVFELEYNFKQLQIFLNEVVGYDSVELVFFGEASPCTIVAAKDGKKYEGYTMCYRPLQPYKEYQFENVKVENFDKIPF